MSLLESHWRLLFQPLTRKQAANRNRSSINMKNFKKFNARRKWKVSEGVDSNPTFRVVKYIKNDEIEMFCSLSALCF